MSDDGSSFDGEQRRELLSLYDLLMTELSATLTPEQEAVLGFTRHQLRNDQQVPADVVVSGLGILGEQASADGRPDLWRRVRRVLYEVTADPSLGPPSDAQVSYSGPPLTRPQLRRLRSLYDLALAELHDALAPDEFAVFDAVRHRLRNGLPVTDLAVMGLRELGRLAADHRRSDLVVRLFRAYLDLIPDAWSIWYDFGNHLVHLADLETALSAYDEALRRNPDHAYGWYNRGWVHYELKHYDDAVADFVAAARLDCDLRSFANSIIRRIIKVRGFVAAFQIINDSTLPLGKRQELVLALREAIDDSRDFDGFYLTTPPDLARDAKSQVAALALRAELADIRRESPLAPGFLFFSRTPTDYNVKVVEEAELLEKLWYLPPDVSPGPPDRVRHLQQLEEALRVGRALGALEALWAVHYVAGAIALSCLMDGAVDWPSPVLRLAVARRVANGVHPDDRENAARVSQWIRDREGKGVSAYALDQFRAAADTLKELSLALAGPDTEAVIHSADMNQLLKEYIAAAEGLVEQDTAIPVRLGSVLRAESLWLLIEPVYREWVLAADYGGRPDARLTALCHARQFNALAATELWSEVPAERWQACRARIVETYGTDITISEVQEALGPEAVLADYHTYEIFGETVSRLAVTASDVDVMTRDVDVTGGELRAMITSGRPAALSSTGFPSQVEDPLVLPSPLPRTVVLVPYGYLRELPIHALPTVRAAIDRGEVDRVVYLPTVSYATRPYGPAARPERALFVGCDPAGDIGFDEDLESLHEYVGEVTVLTDDEATHAAVLAEMQRHDLVHFACHGDLDPRLAAGYLELADARLYPWDVLSLSVPRTVVMNACLGISVQRIETTSDGAFGLHDAFLLAGARHVVGGLWEVHEWTARQFAKSMYRRLSEGTDVPAAVASAQQDLHSATPDPFLWAPHACFGEWRS
ncbi:CHAT domain-containing protein [Actinomadura decatromicini]|uniref:CHAT domain-containing protein n=1 Tax=Actinomadura decatromicini TaxID=2604572 RepID=A0A5D3F891_9ACTN|nr:CHAT domain-containing tetratricopeptide repeat protein [Actinomadura decatromicini]TYK44036.1 CHAT domain-containing protein [Actinomadura decatromicini]